MMIGAAQTANKKHNYVFARKHALINGLVMNALANGWVGSMDVSMVWTWMHWPMDGLVAWAKVLGMDALANGWVGSKDISMVWAWMHWKMDGWVAWTDGLRAWTLSWCEHASTGHGTMQT